MSKRRVSKKTAYQKIMDAVKRSAETLTLNYDDLTTLGSDTAIRDRADNDDEIELELKEARAEQKCFRGSNTAKGQ